MFFTLTVDKETVVDGQPQKHCSVELFSDSEKTQSVGNVTFIAGGTAYDDPEAEFSASLNSPPPPIHVRNYQDDRRDSYPSIEEQLDLMYHGGYDAWKAAIESVKTQFPKP